MLIEHCKDMMGTAWVFVCYGTKFRVPLPYTHTRLHHIWKDACRNVGVDISLYAGTRHSVASQAINRGFPERLVGDFLGHSGYQVTRKYAHTNIEALRCVPNHKAKVIPLKTESGPKK
ncbi:MAG: tyrosine-type recombinase/integrase [Deltaproteobacteria bacterium]|nr:tyrosine-type recombinase/integrase [Deltaproteobacteria bacterium]MBW2308544.1 tyrosine-type recombinase/integrase [Deltaproteobacteria bacterium]